MFFCIQIVRVTENKDYNETLVLSLCEENNWRKITEQNKTREGLRREMSKCLFMPNWDTDGPVAMSDNIQYEDEGEVREGMKQQMS